MSKANVSGTLYTYPENFRAYKALIAAQYSGAKVKVAEDFVFGETNKSEEFLKKFPTGKVPAFETSDGKYLSESNAIAFYCANEALRGRKNKVNLFAEASIQQWISFADNEILPASCAWVFPLLGIMQFNKVSVERAKEDATFSLKVLNQKLLHSTFLAEEYITLADVVVFCNLLHLYQYVLEPSLRAPFGCVTRWFTTMLNQPEVKAVIPEFTLCEKTLVFDPKKFAELHGKAGGEAKKDKKPKEPKEPKEQKEVKADKEEEKQEEEAAPSGFDMEAFKRFYSNEDESKSIPYFWEKFDAENYSIWFGEYKYNDELTKVFMSCNLITGMFQRLDKMRKVGFASVCLFGNDNDSTISGVWVWKGHDLIFTTSPDLSIDYESYDWKKLDPNTEETKKLVQQYFSWTGTDKNGRKFNQGKVFK